MDKNVVEIQEIIESLIQDSSLFLVDLYIKPTNDIKVFLDGDNGITIDTISKTYKALYRKLEESALFPDGDFSLEVSSPGVDKPLKHFRQYAKNIGRKVNVTLEDGSTYKGVLKSVNEDELVIQPIIVKKKNKEEEVEPMSLTLSRIKSTIVDLEF